MLLTLIAGKGTEKEKGRDADIWLNAANLHRMERRKE
jgi:hypothetical protein